MALSRAPALEIEATPTPSTSSSSSSRSISYTSTDSPTITGYSTNSEVSISEPVTLPYDSTSSPDSTNYIFSGTGTTNLMTSTTLPADGTTSSRFQPPPTTVPQISPTTDRAPSGDTPPTVSFPTSQTQYVPPTAGADKTGVPPDTSLDVSLPDLPPEVQAEVPTPSLPPTVAPSPDVTSSDAPPPDVTTPAVRSDVSPGVPSSGTPEYPIDVLLPEAPPPDFPVQYLLPPSEGKGDDSTPDTSSSPVDRSDPAGDLAPVDFTFPFPEEPNSANRQPNSRPDLGSDSGRLMVDPDDLGITPDDSRGSISDFGSDLVVPGQDSALAGPNTQGRENSRPKATGLDSPSESGDKTESKQDNKREQKEETGIK